jgi:hypothetical protein
MSPVIGQLLPVIVDGAGVVRRLARWAEHRDQPGHTAVLEALGLTAAATV